MEWGSRKETKTKVLERFLNYLRSRGDVQVDSEELISGLNQHFHLLPTRYALDVTTESLDILNHFNLLSEARKDHAAVFFHVRLVEVLQNVAFESNNNNDNFQSRPVAMNIPSSTQPQNIPFSHQQQKCDSPNQLLSKLPKPAFGSSPGLQTLGAEMGVNDSEDMLQSDHYVSKWFWEVTVASVDQVRLLAKLTDALGDIGLSIREAHAFNTADGMALDVFVTEGWGLDNKDGLEQALGERFAHLSPPPSMPPITEGVPQNMDSDIRMLQQMQSQQQLSGSDWEIDVSKLHIDTKVGQGQFGMLYKGTYCGQNVAVKILKGVNASAQSYQEFSQEVAIMRKVRHKNVVQFIGACTQKPNMCIVFEFMSGGSLYDYLKCNGPLELQQVLKVGIDVANGMDYLHRMGIIHRDLKAANLLLDENFVVKIGDFGVARILSKDGVMTAETGTYRWMAPEVVEHRPYGPKADVFSFGIVLWELLTGHVPYQNMSPLQAAVGVVQKGMRPQLPPDTPNQLARVIQQCWQQVPEKRPSFSQLKTRLGEMQKYLPDAECRQIGGKKNIGAALGQRKKL